MMMVRGMIIVMSDLLLCLQSVEYFHVCSLHVVLTKHCILATEEAIHLLANFTL